MSPHRSGRALPSASSGPLDLTRRPTPARRAVPLRPLNDVPIRADSNAAQLSAISRSSGDIRNRPEGPKQQSPGRKPTRTVGPRGLEAWVVDPMPVGGLKVRENTRIQVLWHSCALSGRWYFDGQNPRAAFVTSLALGFVVSALQAGGPFHLAPKDGNGCIPRMLLTEPHSGQTRPLTRQDRLFGLSIDQNYDKPPLN